MSYEAHRHTDAIEPVSDEEIFNIAEFFKVFGDSTRIRILYLLAVKEMCVSDLAGQMGITQPAVSYQLRLLKTARLVKPRRQGKETYYALDDEHISAIIGIARSHLEESDHASEM